MNGSDDILITIGAIILFSILALNANSTILLSTETTVQAEYLSTAVDLSESLMMEVVSKSFDENTINASPDTTGLSSHLGTDGEIYPKYDDIDDYNGYKVTVKTKYSDLYTSNVKVQYVNPGNFSPSNTPTSMKKITVSTYSPSLVDTVRLNYYSSY